MEPCVEEQYMHHLRRQRAEAQLQMSKQSPGRREQRPVAYLAEQALQHRLTYRGQARCSVFASDRGAHAWPRGSQHAGEAAEFVE
jgi:hypothetical protein